MEHYYNKSQPKFDEAKLRRVFIPRNNPGASNKEEFEKKAQQIAGDLRERLAKGEDPDVLEKEAYTSLALEAKPMPTDFGSRRKGSLPPEQDEEIFSLPPGSATKVESVPPGFVIYKVESRQTLPLDKVKRSEEHTSELQSRPHLVCRLLLEKKKTSVFHNYHLIPSYYWPALN